MSDQHFLRVGRITGPFGIRGWVKVFSETDPKENIYAYTPWRLSRGDETREVEVIQGKSQGKGIVIQLQGVTDRESAARLAGWDISIRYAQLPETGPGEYYWADLVGLQVVTERGDVLGHIDHMLETGANDVIVVKGDRERLIPFLQGDTILAVDLQAGVMTVDWDPEF